MHRTNYDAIDTAPIRYIILTQGHIDHVGGIDTVADPDSEIVAQANWETWRRDNELLAEFPCPKLAFPWVGKVMDTIEHQRRAVRPTTTRKVMPTPTMVIDDELVIDVGGRRLEALYATPGGETTDRSLVVWLPEEDVCLCGNVFRCAVRTHPESGGEVRGDRYRDALTVVESIERVRALGAETLLTGHFGPIVDKDASTGSWRDCAMR